MIIEQLQGAYLLLPIAMTMQKTGYVSHKEYAQHLKKGAFIGCYNENNKFIVNKGLTEYYRPSLGKIASSLACSSKDSAYHKYKIASIEKSTLKIHFEWHLEQFFKLSHIPDNFAKMAKLALEMDVFVVDMNGPCYDIFVPKAVYSILPSLGMDFMNLASKVKVPTRASSAVKQSSLQNVLNHVAYIKADNKALEKHGTAIQMTG